VSFDPPEANRAFADEHSFPFRLLSDTRREMALAFGACGHRSDPIPRRITYVIDAAGIVERAWVTRSTGRQAADLLAHLARSGEPPLRD
jgi:peroxiredoxin